MSDWRGWQLLAIFLLSGERLLRGHSSCDLRLLLQHLIQEFIAAVELVQGDRCPTKGCLATFEPVVASDGQVFLNSCVAACYAASIVRGGK
jgi:hypothetical protein